MKSHQEVPSRTIGQSNELPTLWTPAVRILCGVLILLFIVILTLNIRMAEQHRQVRNLTLTQLEVERSLGYGGFIHNFKNAVLRPNEPYYLEAATRQFDELALALDTLQKRLAETGTTASLQDVRATFAIYSEKLHILREKSDGPTARELDALVRVTDNEALSELEILLDGIIDRLQTDYDHTSRLIYLNLTFALAIFVAVIWLFARISRIRTGLAAERARAESLEQSNIELDQANMDLRAFSYALSHDLKSPTNTARMLLRELREHPTSELAEEDQGFLEKTDLQMERIQNLIGDVLHYTKVIGQQDEIREVVDLNEVMRDVLADLEGEIHEAGAEVKVAAKMPSVWAHRMQVRLLLQNLVSNAIKYRREDTPCIVTVRADTSSDGKNIQIQVQDNGPGIPAEYQAKVFEMFQRIDKRTEISGTGLGLALCRRVAFNHGGRISVDSHASTPGAVFSVTLPHQSNGAS